MSREAGDLPADGDILFATDGREKSIYALRYDPKKETIRVVWDTTVSIYPLHGQIDFDAKEE